MSGGGASTRPAVLITGANRGLGLEFARQYAAAGWRVLATCRDPISATALQEIAAAWEAVSIHALDVTDGEQLARLARELGTLAIDLLILNSAWLGPQAGQRMGELDATLFERSFAANATGPVSVAEAFLPHVERSAQKKIVFLGSAAGAIGVLRPPVNLYAYRASKAALHLLARALSIDLAPRGIRVGLVNPGLADTRGLLALGPDEAPPPDLAPVLQLVRAGVIEMITAEAAVTGMIGVIDALGPATVGQFLNYDGAVIPW
ncbi:MAG: SDR family NAD(P)-dependent oxidoreductase [Gammaproteobacteria bacterium]|nr:SDR family NAD(P)-dependent oxidoreductase [Gammaproteobacteria bacterium]